MQPCWDYRALLFRVSQGSKTLESLLPYSEYSSWFSFFFSPISVYYPFSNVQSSTGFFLSNYLIATIFYWAWFARNRATFRNSVLSSSKIIGLIKNDDRMTIFGDRLDGVKNFWSHKSALCSVGLRIRFPFSPLCKYPFVSLSVFSCIYFFVFDILLDLSSFYCIFLLCLWHIVPLTYCWTYLPSVVYISSAYCI